MVDCIESYRPAYPLNEIRAVAQAGNIIYGGKNVRRDINNLGYTQDEVIHCIVGLHGQHYQKTLTYTKDGAVFDAYVCAFEHLGQIDQIYMKLRLLPNKQVYVGIGSFHLPR